jgi:hypothetical protein
VMAWVTPLVVVNRWYQGTAEAGALTPGAAAGATGARSCACATPADARTAAPAITHVDPLNTGFPLGFST